MADQSYTATGSLTDAPNLRFTAGGMAVVSFRIGVSNRYKPKGSDQYTDEPVFHNCTAFGSLAENISGSLNKGSRVIVTGVFKQRSYETDSGEKRTVVELNADDVAPSLKWATCEIQRNPRKDER